jgi:SNF2 family DNA or RNA helicase
MTKHDLHPYQLAGVDHILAHPHAGLFLDMGLGKTVTTLTAVDALKFEELDVSKILVVAPKRVAEHVWTSEIHKWAHLRHLRVSVITGTEKQRKAAIQVDADLYTVSRDNVAWLFGLYNYNYSPFDMLVIDELSSFKNPNSQRFKALRKVQPCFKRIIGLTGTPTPKSLIDLWAQMYLLDRGERLGTSLARYREQYFTEGARSGYVVYNYAVKDEGREAIYSRIGDIIMSMKAEDYLDMPDLIVNDVQVHLPAKVKALYDKLERDMILEIIDSGAEVTAANAAGLTNKLLQFAGGAMYDENRRVHVLHDAKLEALEEIIEVNDGKPVLVAWAFQHERDRIMQRLASYKPRELKTGQDIEDWNAGRVPVMLMHPASGGHGLNLQGGGNVIVWYGNTWSLELYQQFNARLYRQGQDASSVVINRLVAVGTEDETVIQALERKSAGQSELMEAVKAKIAKYYKSIS